jgi:hypothetical protein
MPLPISVRRLCASAVLAATIYAAQPPWEKPAGAWSADDIATLLNSSPWAVQTSAVMEDPRDAREEQPAGPPDTGDRGPGGTPKARWDGEIGRNHMGHLATVPVTVRWDSALPIRQAQKETAAPATSYVISLAGLIPANRYRAVGQTETTSSSDGSVDAHNPEEVLEAFMANSRISIKGYRDWQPENVKLDPATGVVRVFFSRQKAINPGEKEALFTTHFGALNVRVKFRISSMKYHGNIEL